METLFLIGFSFLTSTFTGSIGIGGGIMLLTVMPGLLPAAAIIPVHGAVQIASNCSRVLLGLRYVQWRIFWPFSAGAVVGALLGSRLVMRLPTEHMPLVLGLFILLVTLVPLPAKAFRLPGHYALLGAVQTALSLFVGATGPLTNAFLLREDLPRDRLVNTAAIVMMVTHLLKVLVFGFLGFAFAPHLPLIAGMIVAVSLGSYVGTRLRGRLSETLFRRIFKGAVTVLALRMTVNALL